MTSRRRRRRPKRTRRTRTTRTRMRRIPGLATGTGCGARVEGARDGGDDGSDAVVITEEVTRVVLARVVEYAERNGHFAE